jgi:RimJ/RimL family protein N-acetyltransferase
MDAGQPLLTILGERVALGPYHRALIPLLWRWENDLPLGPLSGDPMVPLTVEAMEADYDKHHKELPRDSATFALYERATLRPIGKTGLSSINHMHRTAEFGIVIGEPECRGKGYGTEATRLVLDYAFTALGLHNVFLRVYAYNAPAIRAYEKAGFKEIGRRREAHRIAGRAFDEVLMDCLATEFHGSTLRALMP